MPAVRPGAAARWARRAANAAQDYADGVATTPNSWEANTLAAQEAHKQGTMAALNEGRFAKGVKKSGQSWWKDQSMKLGPGRFAEGVQQGEATFAEGVAPYTKAIEQAKLSPRGPKGDPRNYKRVQEMGEALRAVKMKGGV